MRVISLILNLLLIAFFGYCAIVWSRPQMVGNERLNVISIINGLIALVFIVTLVRRARAPASVDSRDQESPEEFRGKK